MELQFEIIEIKIERRINGTTFIRAMCLQDCVIIDIEILNEKNSDREYIKQKLVAQYNRMEELKKINPIQEGTII